jgi:hypothetical protein
MNYFSLIHIRFTVRPELHCGSLHAVHVLLKLMCIFVQCAESIVIIAVAQSHRSVHGGTEQCIQEAVD